MITLVSISILPVQHMTDGVCPRSFGAALDLLNQDDLEFISRPCHMTYQPTNKQRQVVGS